MASDAINEESAITAVGRKVDETGMVDFVTENRFVCPLAFVDHEVVDTVLASLNPNAITAILTEV